MKWMEIMHETANPWDNLFQNEGKVFTEPHEDLRELFEDFEIMNIHIDRMDHYCLLASKR